MLCVALRCNSLWCAEFAAQSGPKKPMSYAAALASKKSGAAAAPASGAAAPATAAGAARPAAAGAGAAAAGAGAKPAAAAAAAGAAPAGAAQGPASGPAGAARPPAPHMQPPLALQAMMQPHQLQGMPYPQGMQPFAAMQYPPMKPAGAGVAPILGAGPAAAYAARVTGAGAGAALGGVKGDGSAGAGAGAGAGAYGKPPGAGGAAAAAGGALVPGEGTVVGTLKMNKKLNQSIAQLLRELSINPPRFDSSPKSARFFVIKSYSADDIHKSIKYGVWASTDSGNKRLDNAWHESSALGPIYLFFSVNGSGCFCGMAKMESAVDYSKSFGAWNQGDKWNGQFKVRWCFIKVCSSPFSRLPSPLLLFLLRLTGVRVLLFGGRCVCGVNV
jgi:hypothetical protein